MIGATNHDQGRPAYCDAQLHSSFVSYCTTANVQFYTLSCTIGKEPVYALVIISAAYKEEDRIVYVMDKVQRLTASDMSEVRMHCMKLWKLTKHAASVQTPPSAGMYESPTWDRPSTKRARHLSWTPTDESM